MVVINTKFKLIALFLVLALLPVVPAFADEQVVVQDQGQVKIVVFKLNDKHYYVQDANGNVTVTQMDVVPYIESGRTFVPVRFLGNALGLTDDCIKWDQKSKTATLKGKKTLVLTLGSKIMKSDNDSITMDVAPGVKVVDSNGGARTMLPARWVAEGLGYKVDWDQEKQMVVCYPEGEPKPDLTKILAKVQELNPTTIPKEAPAKGSFINMEVKGSTIKDIGIKDSRWDYDFQMFPNTKVYSATTNVSEFNTGKFVMDGIRLYNFQIINKGTLEDAPGSAEIDFDAIASEKPSWLELYYIRKDGTVIDERQCSYCTPIGQNTWRLRYGLQDTKNNFEIKLEEVKYFMIDGSRSASIFNGYVGVLLVQNPYFKG